jgi:hypothetical protein
MIDRDGIRGRFEALSPYLGERERRLFAATGAKAAGFGGIAAVAQITGIAVSTIGRGLKELTNDPLLEAGRVRQPGGGCKPLQETDKSLLSDLLGLVEPDAQRSDVANAMDL